MVSRRIIISFQFTIYAPWSTELRIAVLTLADDASNVGEINNSHTGRPPRGNYAVTTLSRKFGAPPGGQNCLQSYSAASLNLLIEGITSDQSINQRARSNESGAYY